MEHFDWRLLSLLLFWWYNWVLLEKLSLLDASFVVIDRVWCFLRKPPWGSSLQSKSILSYPMLSPKSGGSNFTLSIGLYYTKDSPWKISVHLVEKWLRYHSLIIFHTFFHTLSGQTYIPTDLQTNLPSQV